MPINGIVIVGSGVRLRALGVGLFI